MYILGTVPHTRGDNQARQSPGFFVSGGFVTAAATTPAWAIELELENKADLAAVGAVKKVADGKAARDKQLGVLSLGDKTPAPVLPNAQSAPAPLTPHPAPALALPGSGQTVMRYFQETTPIANIMPACNARLAGVS